MEKSCCPRSESWDTSTYTNKWLDVKYEKKGVKDNLVFELGVTGRHYHSLKRWERDLVQEEMKILVLDSRFFGVLLLLGFYLFLFFFSWLRHTACGILVPQTGTRDQTHVPCSGSVEPYPLDRQGIPDSRFWNNQSYVFNRQLEVEIWPSGMSW